MSIKIGTAPDDWGVWFPSDPKQTPWHRFLDEVAEAGFEWIELGPYGYLPTDINLLRSESGPKQPLFSTRQGGIRERKTRSRPVDPQKIRFRGSVRKDTFIGQKHPGKSGIGSSLRVVLKLQRQARYVVHNQVRHDLNGSAKRAQIVPRAQARINRRVIDGIESSVGAVNGMEKWQ